MEYLGVLRYADTMSTYFCSLFNLLLKWRISMEKPYLLGWLSRFHSIFKDTISTPAFVLPQNDSGLPSRCGLMAVDRSVLRVAYPVRAALAGSRPYF